MLGGGRGFGEEVGVGGSEFCDVIFEGGSDVL